MKLIQKLNFAVNCSQAALLICLIFHLGQPANTQLIYYWLNFFSLVGSEMEKRLDKNRK